MNLHLPRWFAVLRILNDAGLVLLWALLVGVTLYALVSVQGGHP